MAALALTLAACSRPPSATPEPIARTQTYRYTQHVQPILDRYCVACHACYDAPCQLNLGSAMGVARGASGAEVYAMTRLHDAPPTRLGMDALSIGGWRALDFWTVRGAADRAEPSLLAGMLALGAAQPPEPNRRLPETLDVGPDRAQACPGPGAFADYARANPHGGMPFATAGLDQRDLRVLMTWIDEGAMVEPRDLRPSPAEQRVIARWEQWLNASDPRRRLVARYVFEHLFLFRLHVRDAGTGHFFRLLRATTPPGERALPLATRRPDDPPPDGTRFWYRIVPVDETPVYKTQVTYAIDDARLVRYAALFEASAWTPEATPTYRSAERANPFATFAALPVEGRYRFLLDDAETFIRSFIRGPVCRGQIATDVIRDRFWVMFQAPQADLYLRDTAFRAQVEPWLQIPGQHHALVSAAPQWIQHHRRYLDYLAARDAAYAAQSPAGAALDDIWPQSALTVFRHFDSASVRPGWVGALPDTVWWLDYPLFEQSYYDLVVNYDVFASVSHQLQTRLFFDLIRHAAERNYLRLMPAARRQAMLDAWYRDMTRIKPLGRYGEVDVRTPSAVALHAADPHAELLDRLRTQRAWAAAALDGEDAVDARLQPLATGRAAQRPFIALLPEFTLLRVRDDDGTRRVYSLLRDRAHTNVAFMFGEDRRLEPGADALTVAPGVIGVYPNFTFDVPASELAAFVDALAACRTPEALRAVVDRWGVRRTHPAFWDVMADLRAYLAEQSPVAAGVLDVNRYENL